MLQTLVPKTSMAISPLWRCCHSMISLLLASHVSPSHASRFGVCDVHYLQITDFLELFEEDAFDCQLQSGNGFWRWDSIFAGTTLGGRDVQAEVVVSVWVSKMPVESFSSKCCGRYTPVSPKPFCLRMSLSWTQLNQRCDFGDWMFFIGASFIRQKDSFKFCAQRYGICSSWTVVVGMQTQRSASLGKSTRKSCPAWRTGGCGHLIDTSWGRLATSRRLSRLHKEFTFDP